MPAPGLGNVPMLGAVGAPQVVMPNAFTEITQAIGEYPGDVRKADLEKAQVNEEQTQAASQRLSVLTKMLSANPALKSDPNIIGAAQRAFKGMGMDAPMTNDGGAKVLDVDALGATAPLHDFIAKNWDTLRLMDPADRSKLTEAVGLGAAPPALAAIPRSFLQSPGEATGLLNFVRTSVLSLGKPGGSIDNVIASINSVAAPLKEIGIEPDMLVGQLKPDLFAQTQQMLQNNLLMAKTADEQAKSKKLLAELPEDIARIQSVTDLNKVKEKYYPEMAAAAGLSAGARMVGAQAQAALVGPKTAQLQAQAGRDVEEAQKFHAQTVTEIKKAQTGGDGHALIATLQRSANEAQTRYDKYHAAYIAAQQAVADSKPGTPDYVAAQAAVESYKGLLTQAQADKNATRQMYDTNVSKALNNPGGSQKPHGPPSDMRPGTVEHFQALDGAGKQQYLNNPNVPADVRAYLSTI